MASKGGEGGVQEELAHGTQAEAQAQAQTPAQTQTQTQTQDTSRQRHNNADNCRHCATSDCDKQRQPKRGEATHNAAFRPGGSAYPFSNTLPPPPSLATHHERLCHFS